MQSERESPLAHPLVTRFARWGIVAWSLIGAALLGYIVWTYVLYPVRIIFPIVIVMTVVVYLLDPPVSWLQRRGIGRGWGTLIFYLVFFTAVGVGIAFLVPIITEQIQSFFTALPETADRALRGLQGLADRFGLEMNAKDALAELGGQGSSVAAGLVGGVTSVAGGVLQGVLIFVLGPVLAFYVLVDLPKIRTGVGAAIPVRRQAEWKPVLEQIGSAVGGFFRGQLLVAAFVALASMLSLWIIGLPYWAIVGMIAGIFNLVPMIGPYIGMAVALLIAFTSEHGDDGLIWSFRPGIGLAIASVIALIIVQQLDNHIVSPNVVARTVNLHPVTVMLGLLAFGLLFGFWGLLLAVPVIASIKIVALHYWDTRVQWPPEEPPEAVADGPPPDAPVDAPATSGNGAGDAPVSPTDAGRLAKLRAMGRRRSRTKS